jgi:hypothetical protein
MMFLDNLKASTYARSTGYTLYLIFKKFKYFVADSPKDSGCRILWNVLARQLLDLSAAKISRSLIL